MSVRVFPASAVWKVIVLPLPAFAIMSRNEPLPESFRLVTINGFPAVDVGVWVCDGVRLAVAVGVGPPGVHVGEGVAVITLVSAESI